MFHVYAGGDEMVNQVHLAVIIVMIPLIVSFVSWPLMRTPTSLLPPPTIHRALPSTVLQQSERRSGRVRLSFELPSWRSSNASWLLKDQFIHSSPPIFHALHYRQ